jgi:hypothetical protein
MSEYVYQANAFAKKYGIKLVNHGSTFGKYFMDDSQSRFIFDLELIRGNESYRFKFGQSISSGAEVPTMYDVLSCVTKSDPGTFEDFYSEFGYDALPLSSYPKVKEIYDNVVLEWKAADIMFGDIMDELWEIQ